MNRLLRILKHRWLDETDTQRALGKGALQRIEARVAESEKHHRGEIRVCVEAGLPLSYLWRDARVHERAVAMFGKLRVWDTEDNAGVLIYLLLADHRIEIVADRGLTGRVDDAEWSRVCRLIEQEMRAGHPEQAVIEGIGAVSELLALHWPQSDAHPDEDELPNRPHLLD